MEQQVCSICWLGMPDPERCCKFHIHSPPTVLSDSAESGKKQESMAGCPRKQVSAIFWTTNEGHLYF